jgi:hypothetical protein
MFPTRYNNIEPRVGFAYRLEGLKWLKVMRGGYGISHTPTSSQFSMTPYPNLSPNSSSLATSGSATGGQVQLDWAPLVLPTTCLECSWPSNGKFGDLGTINSVAYLNPKVTIPYVQQWNFGFGFEPGKNYGAEVLYVGSKSTNLFGPSSQFNTVNMAAYMPLYTSGANMSATFPNPYGLVDANGNIINVSQTSLLRPNPMIGAIQSPLNQGYDATYNSLQVQIIRRFSQGVQFNVNYTLSKSLDDSSCAGQFCTTNLGNYTTMLPQIYGDSHSLEKSVTTWDKTHIIRFSFTADLPFGKGKSLLTNAPGVLNQIVSGWKLTGIGSFQSGVPYDANNGSSAGFPDDVGNLRPNWAPGVTGCIENPSWHEYLNVANHQYSDQFETLQMFMPASRFSVGNVPRTMPMCRAPWTSSQDAALLKDFHIGERVRVQLRVEAYSVFNHVSFIPNVNSTPVYTGLNYTNYVNPPFTQVANIATNWSSLTQNIGPQRTMQVGMKIYF